MDKTTPNLGDLRQSVADFYDQYGASFAATRQGHWSGFDLVRPFLQPGKLVVDIGAGNGRLAHVLPTDVPYLGIEPSASFRAAAQAETLLIPGGFPQLPVHDAISFLTCCFAVFQHVPPEDSAICRDELLRITAPMCRIIVTSWLPSFDGMEKIPGRMDVERWIPWKAETHIGQRYVHCPSLVDWETLWRVPGIDIERIGYLDEQGWTETREQARNLCVIARKV